jgi:hypothetical protein
MSFDIDECAIPTKWCGNGAPPKRKPGDMKYYTGVGSRYDCMKIGFGAGMSKEKKRNLPSNSLQQISYVGDVYEKKFKKVGIRNLDDLRREITSRTTRESAGLLKRIFTKKGGVLDKKAYNSTVMYFYSHGVGSLPRCSKI